MYKMINEELRVASCKMSELPKHITDILQPNDRISVLYDPIEDVLVLNSVHVDFNTYSMLSVDYMSFDNDQKNLLKDEFRRRLKQQGRSEIDNNSILEVILILDKVENIRKVKNYKKIIDKQNMEDFFYNYDLMKEINAGVYDDFSKRFNIFQLGYIMGKRAERARRKKNLSHMNINFMSQI